MAISKQYRTPIMRAAAAAALLMFAGCGNGGGGSIGGLATTQGSGATSTPQNGDGSGSGSGSTADNSGGGSTGATTGSTGTTASTGSSGSTAGGTTTASTGSTGSGGSTGSTGSTGGGTTTAQSTGTLARVSDAAGNAAGGVLYTAGNVPVVGGTLQSAGQAVQANGLGGLPAVGSTVNKTIATADPVLNAAAKATVGPNTVLGSGVTGSRQAVGLSALSPTQTSGTAATLGVASGPGSIGAGAGLGASGQLAHVDLGGNSVIGQSGPAAISAAALSPNAPQGTVLGVGVLPTQGSPSLGRVGAAVGGAVGLTGH